MVGSGIFTTCIWSHRIAGLTEVSHPVYPMTLTCKTNRGTLACQPYPQSKVGSWDREIWANDKWLCLDLRGAGGHCRTDVSMFLFFSFFINDLVNLSKQYGNQIGRWCRTWIGLKAFEPMQPETGSLAEMR